MNNTLRFAALLLLLCTLPTLLRAQEASDARLKEIAKEATTDSLGWRYGGGIGLDLGGTGILNPRVGGGVGRFGIGGLVTLLANNKTANDFWNNQLSLQLGMQRLGRTSLTQPEGFQKSIDVLRLNSTYGRRIGQSPKWYFSADLLAQTQLFETYLSNYLQPINEEDYVVSRFINPLIVSFSPGVTYKPNDHFSLQYSPASLRWIFVPDDALAALDIHGNVVDRDDAGNITSVSNHFLGLGSELVARYNNKFFGDRVGYAGQLRLFSNYLYQPQNVDVLFTNNVSIQIWKGLSLDLLGELFYDHDMKMVLDENDNNVWGDPGDRQAPAAQLTGAFLLKYSKLF